MIFAGLDVDGDACGPPQDQQVDIPLSEPEQPKVQQVDAPLPEPKQTQDQQADTPHSKPQQVDTPLVEPEQPKVQRDDNTKCIKKNTKQLEEHGAQLADHEVRSSASAIADEGVAPLRAGREEGEARQGALRHH